MVGLKKNLYDAFNIQNAAEHLRFNGDEEDFFVASDGASKVEQDRIHILNYIVKKLDVKMDRSIPADAREGSAYEIYHQDEFEGVKFSICAYFDGEGDERRCVAVVKIASDTDGKIDSGTWLDFGAPSGKGMDQSLDSFVPSRHYWVPRWQYIVRYLRERVLHDFESNGTEIVRAEPEKPAVTTDLKGGKGGKGGAGADSFGEISEEIEVFAGSKGKIIGPGGSMIKEIKAATGVFGIDLGPKDIEPRPRARDPANITLKGTPAAVAKAKAMIMDIVDAWANNRPPRRDESGGDFNAGGNDGFSGNDGFDTNTSTQATGGWGGNDNDDTTAGTTSGAWADEPVETGGAEASGGGW
ncbi:hypothetical protein EJ08DRAFT_735073 [Tothia fuscella]|uniref:K Homology domain-containing protein n=1 Tax=Tothia fuscella TaxID=1048955 RepID=A0A9P4TWI9_9PEZI|nr:hypothetical protein EJ08DRAFT_735073 [Tothia fuscella]